MIGKLTIDKASMNISYFLYTLLIIKNNNGKITRENFTKNMAEFINVPAMVNGKENRTPYNKSKLPRYFGFVDLFEEDGKQYLILTNRGKELVNYVESAGINIEPSKRYLISKKYRPRFVELLIGSVLFDTFGKNNCGAEQSNTDIEPPKVVFKSLYELGFATSEEICYIMYGLNKREINCFEDGIAIVKRNRANDKFDYSQIMKNWGIENIANDCKIINVFTDENINLILANKDSNLRKTVYRLNPEFVKNHKKDLENLSSYYMPLQLRIYISKKNTDAEKWLYNNILGRIGNPNLVFSINCADETEMRKFISDGECTFSNILLTSFNNLKSQIYLILTNCKDENAFKQYQPLLKRKNQYWSDMHGASSNIIDNKELYEYLVKNSINAKQLLEENKVFIPSNLNIVEVMSVDKNTKEYDFEFKTCLLSGNIDENDSNKSIEEKIMEQYNKSDFSEMELEIPVLYKEFSDKFSPTALFNIRDEDLPRYMFYSEEKNQDNMCYYIEKHPKIVNYFGRIGVYSAYVYGLHYNSNNKSWATGSGKKQEFIDYSQAIEKAKEIRENLSKAVDIVKKYSNTQDIEDYAQMLKELIDTCGNIVTNQWFVKYLHMLFPSMFTTYYSEQWQRFLISKCKLEQFDNIYQRSGELALLSQRTKIPTAIVSKILFNLFGYPSGEEKISDEVTNGEKTMIERTPRTSNKQFPFNVILYGAPGTGKTYSTAEYAVNIIENNNETLSREVIRKKYKEYVDKGQIIFTTFHQNYSYEDFIQGLRPNTENGNLVLQPEDGLFKKIADKARDDLDNDYVIIIDEINRGNISKIFGELITLIEEDKRWGEKEQLSIKLPASEKQFVVPNNLYIIGTMNSADKSISLIDTALRRRFDFIEVHPNVELIEDSTLRRVLSQLNTELKKELDSSDLLIGHSYFLGKKESDLVNILNKNIIPLLYEYHYDVENKVKNTLKEALKDIENIEIVDNKQGRIKVQIKEEI